MSSGHGLDVAAVVVTFNRLALLQRLVSKPLLINRFTIACFGSQAVLLLLAIAGARLSALPLATLVGRVWAGAVALTAAVLADSRAEMKRNFSRSECGEFS